jgi:hypothetical protein
MKQLDTAKVGNALMSEVARMGQERVLWRNALNQSVSAARQIKELAQVGSAWSQIAKDMENFRSLTAIIGQQSRELMAATPPAIQAIKTWHESQRAQQAHVRKMLDSLQDVHQRFMLADSTRHVFQNAALGATAIGALLKAVPSAPSSVETAAKLWAQQMDATRIQNNSVLDNLKLGSVIDRHLKSFAQINKQWQVSPELLNVVGSLKGLQEQIGKIAIPTIDWSSAAALARLLGQEGLEEQLAHLGIEPDGSLRERPETPEKGILSQKQSDALALAGLLLAVIGIWMTIQIFYYQENAGAAQQARNEEQAARQLRQLESLNRLLEQTLERAAKTREECFVVGDRIATVRSKPEHGSAVEGKLMPNEVVRAVRSDGKWVEVEYYHWLHEEYRTGWVMKKYLERVPANYSRATP